MGKYIQTLAPSGHRAVHKHMCSVLGSLKRQGHTVVLLPHDYVFVKQMARNNHRCAVCDEANFRQLNAGSNG